MFFIILNYLTIEKIKLKNSSSLKLSFFIPAIFLIYTLMTLLSSKNSSGLVSGTSLIQSSIYNIWSLLILPILIVMIISSDVHQEEKGLGYQKIISNFWSIKYTYLSKSIKYWFLVFLSQLVLTIITIISNLLTTHEFSINPNLFIASFVIWFGSFPLIVINILFLHYFNSILISVINIFLSILSTLFPITFSNYFWLNPWDYALRSIAILRIYPNGTIISSNNFYSIDFSFILTIIFSVFFFILINYIFSLYIDKEGFVIK